MRRRLLVGKQCNIEFVDKIDTIAGDICIVDNNNLEKYFITSDSIECISAEEFTPIGVVVVPASHTDDGTARIVSLAAMDYNNPDSGNISKHVYILWGGYYNNVDELPELTQTPYIAANRSNIPNPQEIVGWGRFASYLCSDYYVDETDSVLNPFDSKSAWGDGVHAQLAPSPYLEDGSRNGFYHSTDDTGNVLADMNGKSNTEIILAVDNSRNTSWQTAETIQDIGNNEFIHPAAQCCWRYHTIGTNQGDWYLPSAGELGYLASRRKAINASIDKILASSFNALSVPFGALWTSNEEDSTSAVNLGFTSSRAELLYNLVGKASSGNNVRAYLAL